jgi:uncharacterized protein (DUF885 family)
MRFAYRTTATVLILIALVAQACGQAGWAPQPTLPATATQALDLTQPSDEATFPPAPETSLSPEAAPDEDLSAGLEGMDFNSFLEESYKRLLLRYPQTITELGLAQAYGVRNDRLNNLSEAYLNQTQQLEASILASLQGYDRSQLTPEQQLSADIYTWYLDDLVRGQAYRHYDYPVSFLITTGVQEQLLQLFTDLHPLSDRQDAEDYINRLSQVDNQFSQLIDGLVRREAEGVVMPRFLIPWVLGDIQEMAQSEAQDTPFYKAFAEKTAELTDLSAAEREALLAAAEKEISESVLPAYRALADYLEDIQQKATNDAGVWKFPNGEAYYAHALRHHTTTELSAEEIHQLGLEQLDRIHAEMRTAFAALGYPDEDSIPALYSRLAQESGCYQGEEIAAAYEALIQEAEQNVTPVFDLRPKAGVIVIAGENGDYYTPPAVDGSRPGMFYARVTGVEPRYNMPTLAYHEAVPGHHFQLALALEQPLPSFRKGGQFMAFTEGWALYAERLVSELGFYRDDPYGDLGRLQAEAFRAARLVVDTGIHAKKWTFDQAVDFMVENTGLPGEVVQGEVGRYILWPGQATAYMVGMLKILEVRQKAMDALGDQFNLTEFHNLLLQNGSIPLETLEQIVDEYIAASQGS